MTPEATSGERSVIAQIDVTDAPEDPPDFKRIYTAPLPRGCRLKVQLRSSYGGNRYDMSEITQKNGKWVLFNLHQPADKILDRELLPEVERICSAIIRLDTAFIDDYPTQFKDSAGRVWRRDVASGAKR